MSEVKTQCVPLLTKCARCGGTHENLLFRKLRRPHVDGLNEAWTHWALCPVSGEPILMLREKPKERFQRAARKT